MEIKANSYEILHSQHGIKLMLNIDNQSRTDLLNIQDDKSLQNDLAIKIDKWREKRSLDANAYMWKLLNEMAIKLHTTKEELYKEHIKRVGVFQVVPVKKDIVEAYIKRFEKMGNGWVCEIKGDSKINGYVNVITYFGSSTYNTKEMSVLISDIREEAQALGIKVLTPKEEEQILMAYKEKNGL